MNGVVGLWGYGMVIKVKEEEGQEVEELRIIVPSPNSGWQDEFVRCVVKRQAVKAGRQSGKTFGASIKAVDAFLGTCWKCLGEGCGECDNTGRTEPKRVLYAAPTAEQLGQFWYEVCDALGPGIEAGQFKKDETEHTIEYPGTNIMIKAKTAWNANTLRGGNWEVLILEEYQLMNEDTWTDVGVPMLLLSDGVAIFIFTPPSLKSEGVSKAKDPRHASKLFKRALADKGGRYKTFHATSFDNPDLSREALKEIGADMSDDTYRREILAEDDEVEKSWVVYSKFNYEMCKLKRFTIPDNWPVLAGQDFGTANPAALFVAQVRLPLPVTAPTYLRYGDYVAFAEYCPGAGYSAQQHVDRFREILGNLKLERAVGGNVTTEEETRQLYRRFMWPVTAPHITSVKMQVDRAINVVEQNQLYVFEDLYYFLGQLSSCMWALDTENKATNKIKDEAKYHLLACLRYLATLLEPRRSSVMDEMPVWSY